MAMYKMLVSNRKNAVINQHRSKWPVERHQLPEHFSKYISMMHLDHIRSEVVRCLSYI